VFVKKFPVCFYLFFCFYFECASAWRNYYF